MPTNILIIEDDTALANKLAEKLRDSGYATHVVHDGEEGWAQIRGPKPPDLIILDTMLPKLDGLSICRMVRQDSTIAHIPILMLTARATEVDKIITLESGADDHVVKPVGLGELLARVRALLRRGHGESTPVNEIVVGDLRLNSVSRFVYKGAEKIHLSHKEFELLTEFMRNRYTVLSRDLLLTKIWGSDSFIDRRTVDVHVNWLRKKIEDNPAEPHYIITVRGVGYRFEGGKLP
jgi:DNA-binding response OmpR family regulator